MPSYQHPSYKAPTPTYEAPGLPHHDSIPTYREPTITYKEIPLSYSPHIPSYTTSSLYSSKPTFSYAVPLYEEPDKDEDSYSHHHNGYVRFSREILNKIITLFILGSFFTQRSLPSHCSAGAGIERTSRG